MNVFVAELLGTTLLILLGNGVVANVLLTGTKGNQDNKSNGSGWVMITFGWGFAVFVAVFCVGQFSGAHLNPAVTIGLAAAGEFEWALVPSYLVAQMAGAMLGSLFVFWFYKPHFDATKDPDLKLATFCTSPAIRYLPNNLFCEIIATFVLVFAVLLAADPEFAIESGGEEQQVTLGLGSLGAIPVGMIVLTIGLCLGGTTGYAINPARDLGPRIVHAILPIKEKRDSDWSYSPVPVIGPILGGLLAAILYQITVASA